MEPELDMKIGDYFWEKEHQRVLRFLMIYDEEAGCPPVYTFEKIHEDPEEQNSYCPSVPANHCFFERCDLVGLEPLNAMEVLARSHA